MDKQIYLPFYFLLTFILILGSCKQNPNELSDPFSYSDKEYEIISANLNLPFLLNDYGKIQSNGGSGNILNAQGTLGRVLFYDPKLSIDGTVSCSSCHKQELAFADDVAFSNGVNGQITERNSISMGSVVSFAGHYNGEVSLTSGQTPKFFWDERASSLAEQMIQTLENEKEMGVDFNQLAKQIEDDEHYKILFKKAFQKPYIESSDIVKALEVFVNSIVSDNAPFDIALRGTHGFLFNQEIEYFTDEENLGKSVFLSKCASCHAFSLNKQISTAFSNHLLIANNGLDVSYLDKGIGGHSGDPELNGTFKIPGLRNVELSAPYMHDGRFATLDEVIDFYSEGIQNHEYLDNRLRGTDQKAIQFKFTDEEKIGLVAFLKTLTGYDIVREEKWSDPFKN